jgi:hypothetical protein
MSRCPDVTPSALSAELYVPNQVIFYRRMLALWLIPDVELRPSNPPGQGFTIYSGMKTYGCLQPDL